MGKKKKPAQKNFGRTPPFLRNTLGKPSESQIPKTRGKTPQNGKYKKTSPKKTSFIIPKKRTIKGGFPRGGGGPLGRGKFLFRANPFWREPFPQWKSPQKKPPFIGPTGGSLKKKGGRPFKKTL